jgi:hypothetical protein
VIKPERFITASEDFAGDGDGVTALEITLA